MTRQKPTVDKAAEAREEQERDLDEALEELFPASDPPAITPAREIQHERSSRRPGKPGGDRKGA